MKPSDLDPKKYLVSYDDLKIDTQFYYQFVTLAEDHNNGDQPEYTSVTPDAVVLNYEDYKAKLCYIKVGIDKFKEAFSWYYDKDEDDEEEDNCEYEFYYEDGSDWGIHNQIPLHIAAYYEKGAMVYLVPDDKKNAYLS